MKEIQALNGNLHLKLSSIEEQSHINIMSGDNTAANSISDQTSEYKEMQEPIRIGKMRDDSSRQTQDPLDPAGVRIRSGSLVFKGQDLLQETKVLRDTLDLLWNHTSEQRQLCEQLKEENDYLQDYISNLMTSSNVLDK